MSELLLQSQKRKSFLHQIITGEEKWIYIDNLTCLKAWIKPGEPGPLSPKRNYALNMVVSERYCVL